MTDAVLWYLMRLGACLGIRPFSCDLAGRLTGPECHFAD